MAENIELERFPTSATAQRMMSRVSPIYDRSYVAKWLYQVMGLEWDHVWVVMDSLWEQPFLEQATWGLRYWEQAYGLDTDETKSYEERRRLVAAKRDEKSPMSPARLETILSKLTGCDVLVAENTAPYTFQVVLDVPPARMLDHLAVLKKIRVLKPSHLSAQYHACLPDAASPLRIGVTGSIITRLAPVEQPDNLNAAHTVYMGGHAQTITRRTPTEQPDNLSASHTVYMGGQAQTVACRAPAAQQNAPPKPRTVRTGGTGTVVTVLRGREI